MKNQTCEVYAWGSNSSHQLGEVMQEKVANPRKILPFSAAQTVSDDAVFILMVSVYCDQSIRSRQDNIAHSSHLLMEKCGHVVKEAMDVLV